MTKNELSAMWRRRTKKAEAALAHTEEAARMYCERTMAAEEREQKAEAELAALKCCGNCRHWIRRKIFEAEVCAVILSGDDRVGGSHVCDQWLSRGSIEATKED